MRIVCLSIIAFVCGIVFSGCAPKQTSAEKAAKEQRLVLGNSAEPSTLDPALATGVSENRILSALFEGLVGFDSQTLKPEPAAAQSWRISADKKTYTFKIDPAARWSNGEPLTAEDFAYSWRRAVTPSLGAEYASMYFAIENAEEINAGRLPPEKLGVRAVSKDVFEVRLARPVPYFLNMLAHSVFYPVHAKSVEKFGGALSRNGLWTLPQNMVSNGPFTLEKWSVGDCVRVRRNPDYRDSSRIKLSAVEFLPIENMNTEERAFRAGQIHMTNSVAHSRIEAARKEGGKFLRISPWLGVYYYLVNTRVKPLDDVRVRKALSMSIDRKSIIENLLKGGQRPAYSFVPDGCGGYKAEDFVRENAMEAREMLKAAGYENAADLGSIRISYNTSELHKPIAEAVQQMWQKRLGVDAQLFNLSWPAYLDERRNFNYMITRASWIGDFDSPETFLEMFQTSSRLNHSGFSSEEFDSLMLAARNAKTFEERLKLLNLAEGVLMDNCPIIPIYFYTRIYLMRPEVKNWGENILDWQNFKDVYLQRNSNGRDGSKAKGSL